MLWVLGSQVFHHITGGQMMLVESVLAWTYYGWDQMMLSSVKQKLSLCRKQVNHDYAFCTFLCAFFFEKIPPFILMYRFEMGAHRNLRCANGCYSPTTMERSKESQMGVPTWDQMPLYIDDYPYSRMNYQGDPNLPLPPG